MTLYDKFSALPEDCQKAVLHKGGLLTGRSGHDSKRVRIVEEVLNCPQGIQRPRLLERAFGHTSTEGTQANTDYQFVTRFLTKHPAYFEFVGDENEQNRNTAVAQTQYLFDLIRKGIRQNIDESDRVDDKELCQEILNNNERLTPGIRQFFAESLVRYVNRTKDYSIMFELLGGAGESLYYRVPYRTRFNSRQRATQNLARYHETLNRAVDQYDTAVMVTLTTDPSKFDSIGESVVALMENYNRLSSWMAYSPSTLESSRPGKRLPYIKLFEFTGGSSDSKYPGLPHLHVVYFDVDRREDDGMPYLIDKRELSEKWEDLGQGQIVQLTPFKRESGDDGSNEFVHWSDNEESENTQDDDHVTIRNYLSKYIGQLIGLAEESEQIKSGGADKSGLELYKLALYWITGRQVWSCSKSLQEPTEPEPEVQDKDEHDETVDVLVRFAGCYRNSEVPMTMDENTITASPLETERLADGAYRWCMGLRESTDRDSPPDQTEKRAN